MNTIHDVQYVKTEERESLANRGAEEGTRLGFVLGLAYIALILAFGFLSDIFTSELPFRPEQFTGWIGVAGIVLVFGGCIGVLPALLLGLITGWSIGTIVERRYETLTSRKTILLGVIVCGMISLPLHLVFWLMFYEPTANPVSVWLFLLGVPSIVYFTAGAWGANNLYQAQTRMQIPKELHSP